MNGSATASASTIRRWRMLQPLLESGRELLLKAPVPLGWVGRTLSIVTLK
jgi:hypothetical protein